MRDKWTSVCFLNFRSYVMLTGEVSFPDKVLLLLFVSLDNLSAPLIGD